MKVSARGWGRDCGLNRIADINLTDSEVKENITYYSANRTYISKQENGDVVIACKANGLRLSGDYLLRVRVTPEDALILVQQALGHLSFNEVVAALANGQRPSSAA